MRTTAIAARWAAWSAAAVLAASAVAPLTARAQDNDAIRAVRLAPGEKLELDGSLAHPAWRRAPTWSRFVERDPVAGGSPPQETRVQVLFDDRALYVGVTALDRAPDQIREVPVRLDKVLRTQDFIVVYLDPIGTRRSAQFFRVAASGGVGDGLHAAVDDSEDFSPDFDWDAAVKRNAEGWTAVLRLPFASLRYGWGDAKNWRIMVARRLPREQFHLVASVPIPREASSFIATMQPLQGVELPEHARFLTLRPSLTLRASRERGAVAARSTGRDIDASLDAKWRPLAELVVDGTLNPDFSQVEIDSPQLTGNTTLALSLAEKRPFFFESADLLRSPIDAAFYTRSFTLPRMGLRATWRSPDLAGSAFLIDDRGRGITLVPGAYATGVAEQPASRTLAARGKLDRGTLHWGGMLAARRYEDGRGDNQVLGPDFGGEIDDAWRLHAQWLHSRTTAQPDAAGQLRRAGARDGDRVFLRLHHQRPLGETVLLADDISAGFRHDSGFVTQADFRLLNLFHSQGWEPLGPFNRFYLNFSAEHDTERSTGQVVKQFLRPGFWSAGARNLEWELQWFGLSRVRSRAGGPLVEENYLYSRLVLSPSPWLTLVDTNLAIGRLADTAADKARSGLRWNLAASLRPLRALEVDATIGLERLEADGERKFQQSFVRLLGVWHFDAKRTLRLIAQRSALDRRAEPGIVAEKFGDNATSLTYAFRRSSGTVMYVGAGRARAAGGLRTNEAFVKLQADIDELRAVF